MIFNQEAESPQASSPYAQKPVFKLPTLGIGSKSNIARRTKSTTIIKPYYNHFPIDKNPNEPQTSTLKQKNKAFGPLSPGKPLLTWNQVEDLRQPNDSPLFKFELHPKGSPQQDRNKSNDPKRASPTPRRAGFNRSPIPEKNTELRRAKPRPKLSTLKSVLDEPTSTFDSESHLNLKSRAELSPGKPVNHGKKRNLSISGIKSISNVVDRSDIDAKGLRRDDNVTPVIDILASLQDAEHQSPKINYELMKRKSVNTLVLQQNKKTKPPSPHIKNHKSFSQLPRADLKEMISPYRLTSDQDGNGIHRNNILDYDPESLSVIDDISKMSKSAFYKKEVNCVVNYDYKTRAGKLPGNTFKPNQDNFITFPDFCGDPSKSLFAVCDGHGAKGHLVSNFIRNSLPSSSPRYNENNLLLLLENIEAQYSGNNQNIPEILKQGFLKTNAQLATSNIDARFSGSTLVSVLISGEKLWCANVGDSRAILVKCVNDSWSAHPLSNDHKPGNSGELERINNSGGRVEPYRDPNGNPIGPDRVWLKDDNVPGLAMSRSIGDFVANRAGVIAEPEILKFDLTPDDKFIIIASDGIWEFLSNEQVMDIVVPHYNRNNLNMACKCLVKLALDQWNLEGDMVDDITCVMITLKVPSPN